MFKVYLHTCPNGKYYVGQTRNPLHRWSGGGSSYKDNRAFYNDIKKFGWDNIKHEIIYECETRTEAESLEKMITILLDSENPDVGYNNTSWVRDLNRMLDRRHEYIPTRKDIQEQKNIVAAEDTNPFTFYDVSVSEAKHIISEWIFDKTQREMAVEKFIDNDSFKLIAQRHGKSITQAKRIVYGAKTIIEEHM